MKIEEIIIKNYNPANIIMYIETITANIYRY